MKNKKAINEIWLVGIFVMFVLFIISIPLIDKVSCEYKEIGIITDIDSSAGGFGNPGDYIVEVGETKIVSSKMEFYKNPQTGKTLVVCKRYGFTSYDVRDLE